MTSNGVTAKNREDMQDGRMLVLANESAVYAWLHKTHHTKIFSYTADSGLP
jgi:hypothetical protein